MRLTTTQAFQFNNLLRQISLIVLSILMIKMGVKTDKIGLFETFIFLSTTASFFWLNPFLQGILVQYPSIIGTPRSSDYKFTVFVFTQLLTLVIIAFFVIFKQPLLLLLTGSQDFPNDYFITFCIYIALNFPPFLLESFWIVEQVPLSILTYSIVSYIFMPLLVVLPIGLGYDLGASLVALVFTALLRYMVLITYLLNPKIPIWESQYIRPFLILIMPLVAYAFLNGFATTFTQWLINWYFKGDKVTFALYRMGARELPISLALATGLSSAIVPILSQDLSADNLNALKQKTARLAHFLFPLSAVLLVFSKLIFKMVFNEEYIESAAVFNVFLLIVISRAIFPNSILLALKETSVIFKISVVETFSIVILSLILVEKQGIVGIAWATMLGFLIEKFLMIVYLHRKYKISPSSYIPIKWYCLYSICLLSVYVWCLVLSA